MFHEFLNFRSRQNLFSRSYDKSFSSIKRKYPTLTILLFYKELITKKNSLLIFPLLPLLLFFSKKRNKKKFSTNFKFRNSISSIKLINTLINLPFKTSGPILGNNYDRKNSPKSIWIPFKLNRFRVSPPL